MKSPDRNERARRDWTLLIFIIPIGIILMLVAGQIAIRLVPFWSVDAEMRSRVSLDYAPGQQLFAPLLPSILTPFEWLNTILTPGTDGYDIVSDFVILDPSLTPPTSVPPTSTRLQPTPASTSTPTAYPTITLKPTNELTFVPQTPATPSPSVTASITPSASATPITPSATATATTPPPKPTRTPIPPPPAYVPIPPPVDIGVGPPDGQPGLIAPGSFTIIDIRNNPLIVGAPDGNYDLILNEVRYPQLTGTVIHMDQIIVGLSNSTDGSYYEIFNWGDHIRDSNTNVDTNFLPIDPSCTVVTPECDNREIPLTSLYPSPGTGILIDVDTANGAPPEGTYNYIVIISPLVFPPLDNAQVDSLQVTEVPIPVAPPVP